MKKLVKLLGLVIVAALALSAAPKLMPTRADTDYTNLNGQLTVASPAGNVTYRGSMTLDFTINLSENAPVPWFSISQVGYGIDGYINASLPIPDSVREDTFWSSSQVISVPEACSVDVSRLSNGVHKLWVFANGICNVDDDGIFAWNVSLGPVNFSVFNRPPPGIFVFSPQNTTYNVANVTLYSMPLNFTVDKAASWIGYSLDCQANVTAAGNITLTGLNGGHHTIIVYANDTFGDMAASQPIDFTITQQTPSNPQPPQVGTLTRAIGVTALIACIDLPVFWLKKHQINGK